MTTLLAAGVLTLYTFQSLYALGIYGYRSLVAFGPALVVLALALARRLGWLDWPGEWAVARSEQDEQGGREVGQLTEQAPE